MALFRRKHRGPSVPLPPDPHLPLLSVEEAATLRSLAQSTLAGLGFEPVMHGDHAVLDDGTQLGFDNLARACRNDGRGPKSWPKIVEHHFSRLLAETHGDRADQDGPVLVRLAYLDDFDLGGLTFDYASEPIPGLREVLCVDHPDTVATLSDQSVDDRDQTLPELLAEGRNNLRAMLRHARPEVEELEYEGSSFWCAFGTDVYTASFALVLADALGQWRPGIDLGPGVIFAVPHRHQLAFSVCTDAETVIDALRLIPPFAASGHSDGVGPLSPHTFLWLEGEVTQLTSFVDGAIRVRPGPHLERLLGQGPV